MIEAVGFTALLFPQRLAMNAGALFNTDVIAVERPARVAHLSKDIILLQIGKSLRPRSYQHRVTAGAYDTAKTTETIGALDGLKTHGSFLGGTRGGRRHAACDAIASARRRDVSGSPGDCRSAT